MALGAIACRELAGTNVRANEVYLSELVLVDDEAEKMGEGKCIKASEFARCYEEILSRPEIDGCRVSVYGKKDLEELVYEKRLEKWMLDIETPTLGENFVPE